MFFDQAARIWTLVLSIASLGVQAGDDYSFPKTTTEVLLRAQTSKWSSVELIRVSVGERVSAYRWVEHQDRRDRRGPGKYTQTTRCLLHAGAESVRVLTESADELELHLTISGHDKESKVRILAVRKRPRSRGAWVTISGRGEIYDEFVAGLGAIESKADNLLDEEEITDRAPDGPGCLLRWTYQAIPKGRVLE